MLQEWLMCGPKAASASCLSADCTCTTATDSTPPCAAPDIGYGARVEEGRMPQVLGVTSETSLWPLARAASRRSRSQPLVP
jgi:hypothetical protein